MRVTPLQTSNPNVKLVEPVVERDAMHGVNWLRGNVGRNTLRLMGVSDDDNKPSNLEIERERIRSFIDRNDQLNWMIEYEERIVGAIWINLEQSEYLASPSIHVMIGDRNMRGKEIGSTSVSTVLDYLTQQGYTRVYSRYRAGNTASANLLNGQGFQLDGEPYVDAQGLTYQNVCINSEQ